MNMPLGVYAATKKDSTIYYRTSITYKNKHISLGSFDDVKSASKAYIEADNILHNKTSAKIDTSKYTTNYRPKKSKLSFEKWVILVNFRDTGIYFKTPIYLCKKFFIYFPDVTRHLIFDVDDLFYYSNHKIIFRNGYMFVNDFGMQSNILSRYGIKNHAVCGRDFFFANEDHCDYRYTNIVVVNQYFGVQQITKNGRLLYKVKIHINGNYVVGTYNTEKEAAIAYNKAAALLKTKGIEKNFQTNYVDNISSIEYASIYNSVKISKRIRNL